METTETAHRRIHEKEEAAARTWMEARGLAYRPKAERSKLPDTMRPPRFYGLSYADLGYQKVLNKRRQILNRQRDRFEPLAYSVYNGPPVANPHSIRPMRVPEAIEGRPQSTFILTGGSVYAPADSVGPGLLSAVVALSDSLVDDVALSEGFDGRRLAFAKWLADPDHPLTARSIVNRIWQYHFGVGLAGNPNNFGVMGKKPSHPELLDWLAWYFVEQGWSIKALHRLILSSNTYRQSSRHADRERIAEVDPSNVFLAHFNPRRLTAEEIRDALLAISGELNPEQGGLSRSTGNQYRSGATAQAYHGVCCAGLPAFSNAGRTQSTNGLCDAIPRPDRSDARCVQQTWPRSLLRTADHFDSNAPGFYAF